MCAQKTNEPGMIDPQDPQNINLTPAEGQDSPPSSVNEFSSAISSGNISDAELLELKVAELFAISETNIAADTTALEAEITELLQKKEAAAAAATVPAFDPNAGGFPGFAVPGSEGGMPAVTPVVTPVEFPTYATPSAPAAQPVPGQMEFSEFSFTQEPAQATEAVTAPVTEKIEFPDFVVPDEVLAKMEAEQKNEPKKKKKKKKSADSAEPVTSEAKPDPVAYVPEEELAAVAAAAGIIPQQTEEVQKPAKKGSSAVIMAVLIILAVLVLAGLSIFAMMGNFGTQIPPSEDPKTVIQAQLNVGANNGRTIGEVGYDYALDIESVGSYLTSVKASSLKPLKNNFLTSVGTGEEAYAVLIDQEAVGRVISLCSNWVQYTNGENDNIRNDVQPGSKAEQFVLSKGQAPSTFYRLSLGKIYTNGPRVYVIAQCTYDTMRDGSAVTINDVFLFKLVQSNATLVVSDIEHVGISFGFQGDPNEVLYDSAAQEGTEEEPS